VAYLTEQELIDSHLPGDVASNSTSTDRTTWIEAASAQADGYLRRAGYTLPLDSVGDDVKAAVGSIAAYRLAVKLGLLPEPAHQSAYYLNYKAALEWLQGVAAGTITPIVENGDDEELPAGGPQVTNKPPRDW
jgi:phage gp36-like protein